MTRDPRLNRRIGGLLTARLPELRLEDIHDPRDARGKRWPIESLLTTVVAGIVAGCKGLKEAEDLTRDLSGPMARRLGLPRRVPDTTMRETLVRLEPDGLREVLHTQCKRAQRRKALEPDGFPFGVVTMDGKVTATPETHDRYAQTQHPSSAAPYGLVRTMTCTLVSSPAKVCLDASPIPPETNEMGHFGTAFRELTEVYGEALFQVVTYDAGACSEENGRLVEDAQRAYLFRLKKDSQPTIFREAERMLGHLRAADAESETVDRAGTKTVTRRLWRTAEMEGWHDWNHLRTVLRVESETVDEQGAVTLDQRYFVSSLRSPRLSARHWLQLVRMHWAVENNNHKVWDVAFQEDDRPWIEHPQGMLAVILLRRVAYNLLALFRSVTQRAEDSRRTPWKELMKSFFIAFVAATEAQLVSLRIRTAPATL